MVSNMLVKWVLAVALVLLVGGVIWMETQNPRLEETEVQSDSARDWILNIDTQQPIDIQTATFALG